MKRVLCISSQVARGHVGNSAAVLAVQRLGHEAWPLPTVILSNHPGHTRCAGMRVPVDTLAAMLDALEGNGWLAQVDAVMTGYLPSAAHVAFAASAIERVRVVNAGALVLCDPVLGDDPQGLYVEEAAATAVRDRLMPAADIVTPNRFELSWLAERPVEDPRQAVRAAHALPPRLVLGTSIPSGQNQLSNVLVEADGTTAAVVSRRASVPHGTGDLLAALLLGHLLYEPGDVPRAMAYAVAGVEAAIEASAGADELQLVAAQDRWPRAEPWPVAQLPELA